jgi:hypothetical protein
MSSNYTGLGIQLMTTGEKAGTWGTLTNTNWDIIEQISGGYTTQAITSTPTTLAVSDGSAGATLAHRIIEFTGSIGEATIVTIPLDVQTFYIIKNASSGAYTVQFKYVTGSGSSVTWAAADKGTKIIYATANDVTNPDIVDLGMVTLTGTETLTNKTLTSPAIGTSILDTGGNELMKITVTGSAENEFTMAAGGSGAGPTLSSTGSSDTNIDMNLVPAGTGNVNLSADTVRVGDNNADATITTDGTGDLILNTNAGTNSGDITIADGANGDIIITPHGTGIAKAVDAADATGALKIAGLETIFVPAQAMFGTETNGAEANAVETTATRPVMKVLDFDPSTIEYAQFSIAMPKSWNEGTVTFQAFWAPSNTDTGNAMIGLQGVSVANDATSDVVFGTAIDVTDAGGGAVEDVMVSPVSSAVTISSAAADTYTYFQVHRNATNVSDTFTGDVRLLGIKLFYTTDAANDA